MEGTVQEVSQPHRYVERYALRFTLERAGIQHFCNYSSWLHSFCVFYVHKYLDMNDGAPFGHALAFGFVYLIMSELLVHGCFLAL